MSFKLINIIYVYTLFGYVMTSYCGIFNANITECINFNNEGIISTNQQLNCTSPYDFLFISESDYIIEGYGIYNLANESINTSMVTSGASQKCPNNFDVINVTQPRLITCYDSMCSTFSIGMNNSIYNKYMI